MRYTWLLFDADGTLYDFERTEAVALEATFTEFGVPYDEHERSTYHGINRGLWQQFERGQIRADDLRVRRFERFFEALGLRADATLASDRFITHLSEGSYLIDGAEALISRLSGQHRLAIITNGLSAVQRPRFAASSIGHMFDPVIISDELDVAKPDPAIFDVAFERMGGPSKEEVLLVGDSLSSDMRGGVDYGVDTCWYNPRGTPKPSAMNITHQIGELEELPSLLGVARSATP